MFNDTELTSFRNKFQDPAKPWKNWYESYTSNVDTILPKDLDDWEDDDKYKPIYKLALKYSIDGGSNYSDKIKDFLLNLDSIEDFSEDLDRSINIKAYAIAFDIIYDDL